MTPEGTIPDAGTAAQIARWWEFLGQEETLREEDWPDIVNVACWCAGLARSLLETVHRLMLGITPDEAHARVTELIAAQQALYGSLAAAGDGKTITSSG